MGGDLFFLFSRLGQFATLTARDRLLMISFVREFAEAAC